jgi:hypothetical protein
MVTLFIGISQHLCRKTWDDITCAVTKGAEVTVGAEMGAGAFWATVAKDYRPKDGGFVTVIDAAGVEHETQRASMRVRKLINTAHVMVSDDKGHDTEFVQHALPMVDAWAKRESLHFDEHLIRSDGASSHFKSRCDICVAFAFLFARGAWGPFTMRILHSDAKLANWNLPHTCPLPMQLSGTH